MVLFSNLIADKDALLRAVVAIGISGMWLFCMACAACNILSKEPRNAHQR